MTLRLAAALSLLLGATALVAYLHIMGRGPTAGRAANHLRAMKDRVVPPAAAAAVTVADVEALPHFAPLDAYAAIERRGVTLEGYVQRLMRAEDDDYHLEVAATPRGAAGPDTLYVTAEITPGVRGESRRWSYEALAAAFRPNRGSTTVWQGGPRRVRITGWLLYDYQYDAPPSESEKRTGAPRVSGWEIHPVTRIELWSEHERRFVEMAR